MREKPKPSTVEDVRTRAVAGTVRRAVLDMWLDALEMQPAVDSPAWRSPLHSMRCL